MMNDSLSRAIAALAQQLEAQAARLRGLNEIDWSLDDTEKAVAIDKVRI